MPPEVIAVQQKFIYVLGIHLHMTVCMGKRAFCDMAVFYK